MDYKHSLDVSLRRLSRLERKSFSSQKRFKFYSYLSEILEYRDQLDRTGELLAVRDVLLRRPGCSSKSTDPVRVLIDATSRANAKTKSRWTRALQFAIDNRPS